MSRILFAPVSIISSLLAGLAASKLFEVIWSKIDDQEAPEPAHRQTSWPKLIAALVLQGAIFRLVRGAIDHEARRIFYRGTHRWPGEDAPDPA